MCFQIVLYEPEIPPNTGNIIRLAANTGCELHLIQPLGFDLNEQKLRRAGLDYREWVDIKIHQSLAHYLTTVQPSRLFACTTKGSSQYTEVAYLPGDAFLFGPESRGLPQDVRESFDTHRRIFIPMRTPTRSLNLANAVAIIIYEAWRQCHWQ